MTNKEAILRIVKSVFLIEELKAKLLFIWRKEKEMTYDER